MCPEAQSHSPNSAPVTQTQLHFKHPVPNPRTKHPVTSLQGRLLIRKEADALGKGYALGEVLAQAYVDLQVGGRAGEGGWRLLCPPALPLLPYCAP